MNLSINRFILSKCHIAIIVFGIIAGMAMANEKWLYMGVIFIPVVRYLWVAERFDFPLRLYVFFLTFDVMSSVTGSSYGTALSKLLSILI